MAVHSHCPSSSLVSEVSPARWSVATGPTSSQQGAPWGTCAVLRTTPKYPIAEEALSPACPQDVRQSWPSTPTFLSALQVLCCCRCRANVPGLVQVSLGVATVRHFLASVAPRRATKLEKAVLREDDHWAREDELTASHTNLPNMLMT